MAGASADEPLWVQVYEDRSPPGELIYRYQCPMCTRHGSDRNPGPWRCTCGQWLVGGDKPADVK